MSVTDLRGIAFRIAGNALDPHGVDILGGLGRQDDPVTQLRKEGMPEGIVFIHVQDARYADLTPGSLVKGQGLVGEQPVELILVEVRHIFRIFLATQTALAAVTGDKPSSAGEFVDGEKTVVGTETAACHLRFIGQFFYILFGNGSGHEALGIVLAGDQGSTEGAHDTGDIRTDGFSAGHQFEGTEYGIVIEGSALHHDLMTQLFRVGQLAHLKQRIFDDGIGKSCGDVLYGSTLLLGLFYFGIHEDRTAGSQVDGSFRCQGDLGKIMHFKIQGTGEGLDEGAASRGTGLIQHDIVHDAVLDLDTFHILSADIQNGIDLGVKEGGSGVMCHGLNLAVIQIHGRLKQCFTVTGGAAACDDSRLGKKRIDLLQGTDRGLYRTAVII